MRRKIRAWSVLSVIALIALGMASRLPLVSSISAEKVFVDLGQTPPETGVFMSGTLPINSTISIRVNITNVQDLFSWQIQLYFDPTLLLPRSEVSGFNDPSQIFYGRPLKNPLISFQENYVRVNQSLQSGLGVTEPGTKLLVELYLKIIKSPPKPADPSIPLSSKVSCLLNITNPDTRLVDSSGNELSGSAWKRNGIYEYYWSEPQPKPYLVAFPGRVDYRRDPPSVVGQRFNITILIQSREPLGGLNPTWELVNMSFSLAFDPRLLEVTDIFEGDFLKKFGTTTFASSSLPGKAVINQIYLNPPYSDKFPTGSGIVAIIRFNITYQGQYPTISHSPLNITGISFKDHYGNRIPHEGSLVQNATYRIEGLFEPKIEVVNPQTGEPIYRFFTNTVPLGSRFNVTIVAAAGDLFAYQVYLIYNTTMLKSTGRSWLPKWDNSSVPWVFYGRSTVGLSPIYYEDAVKIADSMLPKDPPQPTFTGTGKLAIIELEIIATAPAYGNISSVLNITNADTYIMDMDLIETPAPKINGYFEYVWAETLPSLEVKPSTCVAVEQRAFNVTIWINTISVDKRLTHVEFKVHYDASLLEAIKVIEGSFFASTGFTFDYYLNASYVTIKHYMNKPYTVFPDGSGPIATITFNGIYQNSRQNNSTLDLEDIILKDDSGSVLLYASPANGLYTILPFGSSILTIDAKPNSAHVGSNIIISGTLKPSRSNANITIFYRNPGGEWSKLSSARTDSLSNYTTTWAPTVAGTYDIRATWPGDDGTDPAESEPTAVTIQGAQTSNDFLLYAVLGTCIVAVVAAVLIYLLKIRKH